MNSNSEYKNGSLQGLSTIATKEDIANGVKDEHGVIYSPDGKRLLKCGNKDIGEYRIKEGTEEICKFAFKDNFGLTSIVFPESLKSIGGWAFENCNQLTSLDVPSGVTQIQERVFKNCSSLKSIKLSASVTSIGQMAFELCENLESIEFVNGLPTSERDTYIDPLERDHFHHSFDEGVVKLPEGLTYLGKSVFNGCRRIHRIELPTTLQEIERETFFGCYAHIVSRQ